MHHPGLMEKPALPPPQPHGHNTVSGGQPCTLSPVHTPPFLFHGSISRVTDVLWFEVSQHLLLLSFKKKTSQGKKPDPMLFENRKCCANAKSNIIIVTPSNSVLNNLNLLNQTDAICAVLKPRLVICFMQKKKAYHMKIAESPQK